MPARSKLMVKADKLFSLRVRSVGFCRRCGKRENLQCAHIISRSYKQVRYDPQNAFCLCAGCHMYFTYHPLEWEAYVVDEIGEEAYIQLKKRALAYSKIDYEEIINTLS